MEKQKIVIVSLSVALFLTAQYIILDKWIETNEQKMSEIYERGYEQGLIDAVITLYQQTQNCQTTTISFGNLTRHLFDMACLQINSENLQP